MPDPILQMVTRLLLPYIQLFGIYLVFYGHLSPGGGFAGGAILGAGFLLVTLAYGWRRAVEFFPREACSVLESEGGLWYISFGLLGLLLGGNVLTNMGIGVFPPDSILFSGRFIVFLSIGIGLKVASTIFSLFLELAGGGGEN